jgi:hypothetical protein
MNYQGFAQLNYAYSSLLRANRNSDDGSNRNTVTQSHPLVPNLPFAKTCQRESLGDCIQIWQPPRLSQARV